MIVDPEDVFVLAPEVGDALTLVTCYPFYYVGKAPRRFIVRALPKITGGDRQVSGDGGGG
jgi:sortase (surface protein transpeptidase)